MDAEIRTIAPNGLEKLLYFDPFLIISIMVLKKMVVVLAGVLL